MTYLEKLIADLKTVLADHTCDISGVVLLRSYNASTFTELQASHRAIDRVQRLLTELSAEPTEPKRAPMTGKVMPQAEVAPVITVPPYMWPFPTSRDSS